MFSSPDHSAVALHPEDTDESRSGVPTNVADPGRELSLLPGMILPIRSLGRGSTHGYLCPGFHLFFFFFQPPEVPGGASRAFGSRPPHGRFGPLCGDRARPPPQSCGQLRATFGPAGHTSSNSSRRNSPRCRPPLGSSSDDPDIALLPLSRRGCAPPAPGVAPAPCAPRPVSRPPLAVGSVVRGLRTSRPPRSLPLPSLPEPPPSSRRRFPPQSRPAPPFPASARIGVKLRASHASRSRSPTRSIPRPRSRPSDLAPSPRRPPLAACSVGGQSSPRGGAPKGVAAPPLTSSRPRGPRPVPHVVPTSVDSGSSGEPSGTTPGSLSCTAA